MLSENFTQTFSRHAEEIKNHGISYVSGLAYTPVAAVAVVGGTLGSGFAANALGAGTSLSTGSVAVGCLVSLAGAAAALHYIYKATPEKATFTLGFTSGPMLLLGLGLLLKEPAPVDVTPRTTEPANNLVVVGSCQDADIQIEAGGKKASIILPEGCVLRPQ